MTKSVLQTLFCVIAVASTAAILFLNRGQTSVLVWRNSGVRGSSDGIQNETYFDPDNEDWPPLDSLIQGRGGTDDIKDNVQFMLDFAIIGHPKTATTFTMNWLASHREIQMYTHELNAMAKGKPAELVSLLYDLPAGRNYRRGYKAPRDIINAQALRAFAQHFPETKLIVGLRYVVRVCECVACVSIVPAIIVVLAQHSNSSVIFKQQQTPDTVVRIFLQLSRSPQLYHATSRTFDGKAAEWNAGSMH